MYLIHHRPQPPLDEYVDFLWCLSDGPTHTSERIVPGGTTELVINLRSDRIGVSHPERCDSSERFSGAVLAGPHTRSFDIDASRHTAMLGVHFKPVGAQAVLGVPPAELRDTHVDLQQLWNTAADRLRERVCEAVSHADRFRIVESALTSRLRPEFTASPAIARAVDALLPGAGPPPIGDLADHAGLSHRQFIKDFTATVGITPKLFGRLCRFRRAVGRIAYGGPCRWAQFACDCGYADQAHMIREFKFFSGLTPAQYRASSQVATKADHVALAA